MKRAMLLASLLGAFLTPGLLGQTQEGLSLPTGINRQRTYLGPGIALALYSKLYLLGIPAVQKELDLKPDQKARLKDVIATDRSGDQLQKELRKARESLGPDRGDPETVAELIAIANASGASLRNEKERALLKLLDQRQRARLEEIALQAEGPMAFTRPEVIKRLNIDPERAEAIKAIISDGREELIRATLLPPDMEQATFSRRAEPENRKLRETKTYQSEVEKSRHAALKVRAKMMQTIGKLLTKNQRNKFDKMLGEPFDLAKLRTPPAATQPADSKDKTKGS